MARKPFVVLDAEILSSSIWSESAAVRLVWITLLILCDTDGNIGASVPGIARAAGVSLEEAETALARLESADPFSRTRANEGRRLERVERGWRVINFLENLDRLSDERRKARERVRLHRLRKAKKAPPRPKAGEQCPCCRKPFESPVSLYVVLDHNHDTGALRDYICQSCNKLVGQAENDKPVRDDAVEMVVAYLEKHIETSKGVHVRPESSEKGPGTNEQTDNGASSLSPSQASVTDTELGGRSSGLRPVPEDQRDEYIRAVFDAFRAKAGLGDLWYPPGQDRGTVLVWMERGVPLRVVLQGIAETRGNGRLLAYYESAVRQEFERQQLAVSGTR